MINLTERNITETADKVTTEVSYSISESMLWELIKKFPENKAREEIAAKLLVIDHLYSTQVFKRAKMSALDELIDNILAIPNFDERVAKGDTELVPQIYKGYKRKLFSFASKYCCLHNTVVYGRDDYSIYDSTVHKLLPKYAKEVGIKLTGAQLEKWRSSGDYKAFNDAVADLLDKAEIKFEGRRRKFDLFIWEQR